MYQYGSAARQLDMIGRQEMPVRRRSAAVPLAGTIQGSRLIVAQRQEARRQNAQGYSGTGSEKQTSRRKAQNRKQTGTVAAIRRIWLLGIACVATVAMCICFLSLKSNISYRQQYLGSLQDKLTILQEANDSRYNHIDDSVNLEEIRERALALGMDYAGEDRIITYETPSTDYVEQKDAIPRK